MRYDSFTYIYPPRAENAIPPGFLSLYEKKGWWAQIKKNGTNSVIFVSPDKEVFAMNRHGEAHKQWEFTPGSKRIFQSLPGKGWYVINAELLHAKVKGIRDINYIHDILVDDGVYLVGETYAQRYARLLQLFLKGDVPQVSTNCWVLDDHTIMARNIRENFAGAFKALGGAPTEDEGLVLKDPRGKLAIKNNGWTVKCRKPQKNFGF